jgi:hypothetical protein
MGAMTKEEQAIHDMWPVFDALEPIKAQHAAIRKMVAEELPDAELTSENMTKGFALLHDFNEFWAFDVPSVLDLVAANAKGKLPEFVAAANAHFAQQKAGV